MQHHYSHQSITDIEWLEHYFDRHEAQDSIMRKFKAGSRKGASNMRLHLRHCGFVSSAQLHSAVAEALS